MKNLLLFVLLTCVVQIGVASPYASIIEVAKQNKLRQLDSYQTFIERLSHQQQNTDEQKNQRQNPRLLLLVSLTLPKAILVPLLQQAEIYHIPVAIRGLLHHSMRLTLKTIYRLVKQNNIKGLLIDPIWFEAFHIKVVPALVATDGSHCSHANCQADQFDVVYGNATLKAMLESIKQHGTVGRLVASRTLREASHE